MPNLKLIGLRLKSVTNIQKITQSMKMVSAAKFAKAERDLKAARPLGEAAQAFYKTAEVRADRVLTWRDDNLFPLFRSSQRPPRPRSCTWLSPLTEDLPEQFTAVSARASDRRFMTRWPLERAWTTSKSCVWETSLGLSWPGFSPSS